MATLVLQAAGSFLGGAFGAAGAAIGSAAGAVAGYLVDRALIQSTQHYEGPRLSAARAFTAEDGAPLPRVYGTARVGGTLIWATRFVETSQTERQGGKGGAKTTTYSYFANAAFALCDGEIAGVRRIWADGREVDRTKVDIRVHRGTEGQQPDPLIEAKQGAGNTPAYRGTAYVVIDRFPIDDYGKRLPQFQFEVIRPVSKLNAQIRTVALIPGSTEYGLSPTPVLLTLYPGETRPVNRHVLTAETDLEAALDELQMLCPNLETVALVTTWFGNDLRAGSCKMRPKVTQNDPDGLSLDWFVSGLSRQQAPTVSQVDGAAAYGGTPADKTVLDAIAAIRARALKVILYPFLMMDIPPDNALPDPYGGQAQAIYPWRGRITCHPGPAMPGTADKTGAARSQIDSFAGGAQVSDFSPSGQTVNFNGAAGDWGYRRFVLHYAHLAALAGGVDGFLLGSEMRGLTRLRDAQGSFPYVEVLEDLASDVRGIVGSGTMITYAADWTEYFGHQPGDGSGDVLFHLDSLWAHPEIDAVGIDNYMPLADWRDADYAGANPDGFSGPYDIDGLRASINTGEGFDWYYASSEDRVSRQRSPITDGAYGKPWVFRYKDLVAWWSNQHFNRIGGVEQANPTAWVPRSKPIMFTELGCGAIDKGPNQPNVFLDAKSSENAAPYFSNSGRSDLAQHRFLQAHFEHWSSQDDALNPTSAVYGGRMVDPAAIAVWAWDARPFPAFPLYRDIWSDGDNWSRGHWFNGRIGGVTVGDLVNAILADHGLPPADTKGADGTLAGYVVADPTTARDAIEPIAKLFGIGVREEAGGLVFAREGAIAGAAAEIDALVLEEDAPLVERVREPAHALPEEAHLDFRDALNDYQSGAALAVRPGTGGGRAFMSFPGVMSMNEAQRLATDWLRRRWEERERVTFSVPITDTTVRPGAVIRLSDAASEEFLVTDVETGLKRTVTARRIARFTPMPSSAELPAHSSGNVLAGGQPFALFLDLPLQPGAHAAEDRFRLAVRAKPWRSQAALVSPENSGFVRRSTVRKRATIGFLAQALAGGVEGRLHHGSTLVVDLLDGELSSISRAQLLNGGNAAAVRSASGVWEIVQFETAEEIAARRWRLSGLLRGQLGTSDAMAAGASAGAPFVLLDDAVQPVGLLTSEIGLELNWRVGPAGADISDANFMTATHAGGRRAQLPLSPVHLNGRLTSGGDLELSWIRRSRIDADSWDPEEIPLGETQELYRIQIAPAGGAVVREKTVSTPFWTYGAGAMASDFASLPQALDVSVSQVSNVAGAGVAATATFNLS